MKLATPSCLLSSRARLPDLRSGKTHRGVIHGEGEDKDFKFYITCNTGEDGKPRELFVTTDSDTHNYNQWATSISLLWQIDPDCLAHTVMKFAHVRQPPSGFTECPAIGYAKSPYDYVMRWVAFEFLPRELSERIGVHFDDQPHDDSGNTGNGAAPSPYVGRV